jgi:hypothetical protein
MIEVIDDCSFEEQEFSLERCRNKTTQDFKHFLTEKKANKTHHTPTSLRDGGGLFTVSTEQIPTIFKNLGNEGIRAQITCRHNSVGRVAGC